MDIGINDLRTLVTVAAFITFVGIVAWAYSGRRADHYRMAAWMATDDEKPAGKEHAK